MPVEIIGRKCFRRARQRARQPLADQQQALTLETEDFGAALDTLDTDGYSPARGLSDFGYSERVGYGSRASSGGEDYGYRPVQNRARTRTRAPVFSDTGSEQTTASAVASESRRIRVRSRMRARLPRRQGSQDAVEVHQQRTPAQPRELYRDERTIVATEAPTRSRSRSRSRHRVAIPSREAPTTEGYSEQRVPSARLSRGRLRERGRGVEIQGREKKYTSPRRTQDDYSSRRSSVSARDKAEPSRAQRPKEPPRSSQSSRIRFPKKNLFGTKVSLQIGLHAAANLSQPPRRWEKDTCVKLAIAIYLSSPSRQFALLLQSPVVSNVTQDSLAWVRLLSALSISVSPLFGRPNLRRDLLAHTCVLV